MNSQNIVLIHVDQWRADCLSIDGHPVVHTPSLDKLDVTIVSLASLPANPSGLTPADKTPLPSPKTKAFAGTLKGLGVSGTALVLDDPVARNLELAARNLPQCKVSLASGVNIVDLLRHDWLVMTEAAARRLEQVLAI